MKLVNLALGAAALMLIGGVAHASGLSDTFDGENGGASSLGYTGFANFNVTGSVDLIGSGGFGITCAGASGSCVDLAGDNAGELVSKSSFGFNNGDVVTLSFDISGNQRNGNSNSFFGGFDFSGGALISDYSTAGAFGNQDVFPGVVSANSVDTGATTTDGSQPFETYILTFKAAQAGTFDFFIGTNDATNVGPILDNVDLTITASGTPEPATWAMLLFGFGALGASLRSVRRPGRQTV